MPIPSYHAYGTDTSESYHFKDAGFIMLTPPNPKQLADPRVKERIEALKVPRKK